MFRRMRFAPPVERAFQLHYARLSPLSLVLVCVAVMLVHAPKLVKAFMHGAAAPFHVPPCQAWAHASIICYAFVMRKVLGKETYMLYRGLHVGWVQLLFALGIVTSYRPQDCTYCGLLWHHRLLLVNMASVVALVPLEWFCLTGVICWLVAAAVDVADPAVACHHSVSCLLAAEAAKAAQPALFLKHTILVAASKYTGFIVDFMLLGLLLSVIELWARKAWWLHLQSGAAAQTSQYAAAYAASAPALPQGKADTQADNMLLASKALSCSTKAAAAAMSQDSELQPKSELVPKLAQRAPQLACSCSSPSCSAVGSVRINPSQAVPPVRQTADTGSPEATESHTNGATTAHQASTAAPAADSEVGAAAVHPASFAGLLADPAGMATKHSIRPATAPVAAVSATLPTAPAAAGHAVAVNCPATTAPEQKQKHRPSALYSSPFDWRFLSIKLTQAPSTNPQVLQQFGQQLAAAVQASAEKAILTSAAAGKATLYSSGQQAPMVVNVAAFSGCYQVLLQLTLPLGQPQEDVQLFLRQLHECTEPAVQHVLKAWPDVQLISTSLGQERQQQQVQDNKQHKEQPMLSVMHDRPATPQHSLPGFTMFDNSRGSSVASAAAAVANGVYLLPVALPLPCGTAVSANSLAARAHSSGTTDQSCAKHDTAAGIQAELCISQPTVDQLVRSGMDTVRVVVAPQQPGEEWLLDQQQQLQDEQQSTDLTTQEPAIAEGTGKAFSMPLKFALHGNSAAELQQEPVVLTVVLLKGCSAAHSTAEADSASTAAAVPLHGVIASLPLLVLPFGAANELQLLYDDLRDESHSFCSAAYEQLQPLLHDFAAALCTRPGRNTIETQQKVLSVLYDALAACFAELGLMDCRRLLDRLQSDIGVRGEVLFKLVSNEGTEGPAKPAIVDAQRASNKSPLEEEPVKSTPAHDSCKSSALGKDFGSSMSHEHAANSSSAIRLAGCAHTSKLATAAAGGAAAPTERGVHAPGALLVGFGTLLHGFQAPVEVVYQAYKTATLEQLDFGALVFGIVCVVANFAKLLMLAAAIFASDAPLGESGQKQAILTSALRALFYAIHTSVCLLLWLATVRPQQLGALQHWRSTLLYGSPLLVACISAACISTGGVLAKATLSLGPASSMGWWQLIVQRHVMLPALVFAPVVPDTLSYLAVQFMLADPVLALFGLPSPAVGGLGVRGTAVLIVLLHVIVACILDAYMRRSFARHVALRRAI